MHSLKKKTVFTALSRTVSTVFEFFTQLLITPLILNGLGQYIYGVYSLINKASGYLSFVDLRPTAILRYKLAVLQHSSDISEKKKFIGAALYLSTICFPIILLAGIVVSYIFPVIFNIANEYITISRAALIVTAVFLGLQSFMGVPEAILRGNNIEYKTIFIEPVRNLAYIGFVWVALSLNYGILGVIFASFASYLIAFLLKLFLQKKYLPEYTPQKPDKEQITEFSKRGGWYLFSSFSFHLLQSLDVIIIGFFYTPVFVTIFTLTKTLAFRMSESVVMLTGSISAGLGDLIGRKDKNSLLKIRYQLIRVNFIIGFILFSYFYLFNSSFINLWVGENNFAGNGVNLLLCLTIPFILLSMSSQIFVDAYLRFNYKAIIIFFSSIVSIGFSLLFVKFWGIVGIALAILLGRVMLWIGYEWIISKEIKIEILRVLLENKKLFLFMCVMTPIIYLIKINPINSWITFIVLSVVFLFVFLLLIFLVVLTRSERKECITLLKKRISR